jgi:hypothetical protein
VILQQLMRQTLYRNLQLLFVQDRLQEIFFIKIGEEKESRPMGPAFYFFRANY